LLREAHRSQFSSALEAAGPAFGERQSIRFGSKAGVGQSRRGIS
jgi:hypothetical protein